MTQDDALTDDGERIAGPAEFVEQHDATDDADVAGALAEHMQQAGLEPPARRGMVGDAYREIVNRIRGRRLVEDFGEHDFSIDWLGFHVPPGAKGQLKINSSGTVGYGVKLEVLGLGFGSGCRRTLTINEDFRERTQCLSLGQRVRARVRSFADRGKTTASHVQVDVLAVLAEERRALDPCPECAAADELDDLQPGAAHDLRGDPVGQVYQESIKLESDDSVDLGLPLSLPGLKLKPSVSLKRSLQLECAVKYDLPGGHCYTPYLRADGWTGLPIWRRS
jgi:hypothetical protein